MKKILNAYYELTVIPAIVLTCLTNLGWIAIGRALSQSDTFYTFLFFLVIMTAEDLFRAIMSRVRK